MQWLIDIVLERMWQDIFDLGIYRDRGDPGSWDYQVGALTINGNWYDLDLSAIVGENAKAVALSVVIEATAVEKSFWFRRNGNVNFFNRALIATSVANISVREDLIVACDANRIIEYRGDPAVWTTVNIIVKGWWL